MQENENRAEQAPIENRDIQSAKGGTLREGGSEVPNNFSASDFSTLSHGAGASSVRKVEGAGRPFSADDFLGASQRLLHGWQARPERPCPCGCEGTYKGRRWEARRAGAPRLDVPSLGFRLDLPSLAFAADVLARAAHEAKLDRDRLRARIVNEASLVGWWAERELTLRVMPEGAPPRGALGAREDQEAAEAVERVERRVPYRHAWRVVAYERAGEALTGWKLGGLPSEPRASELESMGWPWLGLPLAVVMQLGRTVGEPSAACALASEQMRAALELLRARRPANTREVARARAMASVLRALADAWACLTEEAAEVLPLPWDRQSRTWADWWAGTSRERDWGGWGCLATWSEATVWREACRDAFGAEAVDRQVRA